MQLCVIAALGSAPTSFSNDATCHLSILHSSFMFHTFHDDSDLKTPLVNSLKALTLLPPSLSYSQEWSEPAQCRHREKGTFASEDHISPRVHLLGKRKGLPFHCVSNWFPANIVWQRGRCCVLDWEQQYVPPCTTPAPACLQSLLPSERPILACHRFIGPHPAHTPHVASECLGSSLRASGDIFLLKWCWKGKDPIRLPPASLWTYRSLLFLEHDMCTSESPVLRDKAVSSLCCEICELQRGWTCLSYNTCQATEEV